MNFSQQPPSKQWSALTYRGETIAEVWFKLDGEPLALVFRISRNSLQDPDIAQRLTVGNLLKAVAIALDEVESWQHGGTTSTTTDELTNPLPQPPHDATHLEVRVRLKPSPQAEALAEWHDLEAQWKTILGLEAVVETLRKSMESLRAELEASMRRMLTADEKVYALAADVAQWTKAKNRAHYALPKANDFIHRATWAAGTPDRKRLGEVFKDRVGTPAIVPQASEVLHDLEMVRKDRQVLSAKGTTVFQECKAIATDVQAALRRLQANAATRAAQKKSSTSAKGKSF